MLGLFFLSPVILPGQFFGRIKFFSSPPLTRPISCKWIQAWLYLSLTAACRLWMPLLMALPVELSLKLKKKFWALPGGP